MAPTTKGTKGKGVLRRTVELPAALRTELEELGRIPKQGKGKLGRKQQRKQQRQQTKQNRAAHFGGPTATTTAAATSSSSSSTTASKGKRKATEEDVAPRLEPPQKKKRSKSESTASTSAKTASTTSKAPATDTTAEEAAPRKPQTALERMLEKQQRRAAGGSGNVVDMARPGKNHAESVEDREIAWLEAKLGNSGGGPRDELMEDGLDDLFEGVGELESAAFGRTSKDYARLLREQADSDEESAEAEAHLDRSTLNDDDDDDDDFGLGKDDEYGDDLDEAAFGSDGISDEELRDPSDDDDHAEMMEPGSEPDSDDDDHIFDESDSEDEDGGESEDEQGEVDSKVAGSTRSVDKEAAEAAEPVFLPAPAEGAYVPPHLRKAAAAPTAAASTPAVTSRDQPPSDPRLRRQLMGHLNKLSSLNIGAILSALESIYASHPRAVVSSELTSLLLEIVSGRDNLGEQLMVNYAALVAALARVIGVELPAGVVAKSIGMLDEAFAKHRASAGVDDDEEQGFEGRPGSKECENIVAFISELYNFQVVACMLVYDLIKELIGGDRDGASGMGELEVELLAKIVKRSGQQLRQDDPSALKQIIDLVKQKQQGVDPAKINSRTRFMIDSLTNLRNNKIKPDANGAVDNYTNLRKFLVSLKKRVISVPEPLRITLQDLRSSDAKGKWWLVGAAWAGDPLADSSAPVLQRKDTSSDAKLAKLARAQGMNTDIRKGVFTVLMSSEDYVDACERLLQLGLSDVQQREIARVLLQCSGNERAYNPYYTLVAHRMASKSHGFQITLQYCLWDFLREMGEKSVGGAEMVKSLAADDGGVMAPTTVSSRRVANLAKLYAWCVAKDVLSLGILKPIPFGAPKQQTVKFLVQFFVSLLISTQTPSPALILTATTTRRDKEAVERVFIKAAPHGQLVKGLAYFFETAMDGVEEQQEGEKERKVIKFGIKVAKETLSSSTGILVDLS